MFIMADATLAMMNASSSHINAGVLSLLDRVVGVLTY